MPQLWLYALTLIGHASITPKTQFCTRFSETLPSQNTPCHIIDTEYAAELWDYASQDVGHKQASIWFCISPCYSNTLTYLCILIKVNFFRDLPGQIRKGSYLDGFRNSLVQMFSICPQMNVYSYLSVSYVRWLSHFPGWVYNGSGG